MSMNISRRDFLRGAAAGALGIASASLLGNGKLLGSVAQASGWDGHYQVGTYTASAPGKMGDVTVQVVFSDQAIDSIEIIASKETESIASAAIQNIPSAILEGQTLNVNAISGATYTSDAILEAVSHCVTQAGGDVEALKSVDGPEAVRDMAPGTYEAHAHGHHSDVVVEVKLGRDVIEAVKVLSSNETFNLADAAISTIPQQIVDKQSTGLDAVSGATYTSRAILSAVEQCIEQAGGKSAVRAFAKKVAAEPFSQEAYDVDADVVVVGSGMAGIAAALSAQENGAKVAIVEKMPFWGGISQTCKGYFRLPYDGTKESAESYYQYGLHMYCGPMKDETMDSAYPNQDLLKTLAYNAYDAGKWLESKGAQLAWLPLAKIQNQQEYFLGGAHFVMGDYDTPHIAGMNFKVLLDGFVENGGEIYLDAPVTSLLTDGDGAVTGVYSEGKNGKRTFHAKAVILCAGGFGASPEMVKEYAPAYVGEENVTLVGNVGDGIRIATDIGAATYDSGLMMGQFGHSLVTDYDMIHPYEDKETPSSSIFVNPVGLRVNSETPVAYSGGSAYVNPDAQDYYWAICNEEIAGQSDYLALVKEQLENGNERFFTADSVAELAKKINMSANTLRYSLNRYNRFCDLGEDEDFAKNPKFLLPMEKGPWYAVKCFVTYFGTVGGLQINVDSAVLNEKGEVIPGLFAAGENANHGFFNLSYVGGRSMPVCLTMGRIAGVSAAACAV